MPDFRSSVETFFALSMEKSRGLSGTQLITQPIPVGYVDALLAVDAEGLPHLLVPARGAVAQDRRSAAVWITSRELQVGEQVETFADLGCRDRDLVRVFDRLVSEVLEVADRTGERLDLVQSRTLVEWRHLLSAARGSLSHEAVTGLFGELSVLCHLAQSQPQLALDAWVGPNLAVRDFLHGQRSIEVKSRVVGSEERVRISSLDQLDGRGLERFVLAVVDVQDHEFGQSLGHMVDRAVSLGVPRLALNDRLANFGFVAGMVGDDDRRMSVARLRTWTIDASFPALTGADVPASTLSAIVGVTYALDLTQIGEPSIDDWDVLTATMGWAA
ncbi:PD-(D/E)XK motif protein [Janibacter anophelis]|uniref:PD-(D/E)XK motif protein n=1 Tax=Janibacter anophelis TaxID=319054 RepID=UPI003F7DE092